MFSACILILGGMDDAHACHMLEFLRFRGADVELLEWWAQYMTVPVVAIGGITIQNAPALVEAGADFLAVSSGVWNHKDGAATAVREFNRLFADS